MVRLSIRRVRSTEAIHHSNKTPPQLASHGEGRQHGSSSTQLTPLDIGTGVFSRLQRQWAGALRDHLTLVQRQAFTKILLQLNTSILCHSGSCSQHRRKEKKFLKKVKASNLQVVYFMVNGIARRKTPQQWSMLLKPTTQIMR